MVSGDEATCREARKFFGDQIVCVPTKMGISREAAVLYPFDETRKALYEGAKKSISAISKNRPYILKTPVSVKMQYLQTVAGETKPKLVTREWVSPDGHSLLSPPSNQ
jgi:D-amino peptidase